MKDLFRNYERLVDKADAAFGDMQRNYAQEVHCTSGCADCCHAVFGLFIIEAAYLKQKFDQLPAASRKQALGRCSQAERALRRLQIKLRNNAEDQAAQQMLMARERVPCPLLDAQDACLLYQHRPITCRVYGIPTRTQGKVRACSKSGFRAQNEYPVFDLDAVYRELYFLSRQMLQDLQQEESERAALLLSVPGVLTGSVGELLAAPPDNAAPEATGL